jgi:hypothetical protein
VKSKYEKDTMARADRLTRDALMGYHLQADVKHDFGAGAPVYNSYGTIANTRVGAASSEEDATVNFFIDGSGGVIIENLAARKAGQLIFTVPEKTESFQNWKAPVLYAAGNDKIGIIQDAGEFITIRLGSKNVITFGSILDPAGKPIRNNQDPIWFEPTVNDVTIPLAPYGFDTSIIQSVRIKDLTAGTVKASFTIGNAQILDAVAMRVSQPTKPKPINNTDVGFAGFFTSINKAENIAEELSLAGVKKADADLIIKNYTPYFYIGKTLGDASLVASGLPSFLGNDFKKEFTNPFNGTNGVPGRWKNWVGGAAATAPTILALKTGDRLNWLRAIIMNLATIYEDQAKGGRKTKQYKFFPGIPDPKAVRAAIISDFDALVKETIARYNTLRINILNELIPGGVLKLERTTFAPGGQQVIRPSRDNFAGIMAARLLKDIASTLITLDASGNVTGGICRYVTHWIGLRKKDADAIPENDNEALTKLYADTLSKVNACSPQANSLLIQKGKNPQDAYLTLKLIVANVPTALDPAKNEWPVPTSLDIALKNAFVAFTKARDSTDTEYVRLLSGTDIYNRFSSKLPPALLQARGGQRGGADVALDITSINDTVAEVIGYNVFDSVESLNVAFPHMGNDWRTELPNIERLFPRIHDFAEYMRGHGIVVPETLFLSIYDVVRHRSTNRVIDSFLAEELTREFEDFVGLRRGTPYINVPQADWTIFRPDYQISRDYPSSTPTILFNAYTYYVNARNALELTNTIENQSDIDFQVIERAYLNRVSPEFARRSAEIVAAQTAAREAAQAAAEASSRTSSSTSSSRSGSTGTSSVGRSNARGISAE